MSWTKDLQKMMDMDNPTPTQQEEELNKLRTKLFSTGARGGFKPLYIQPEHTHIERYKKSKGQCCFWHIICSPQKDGKDMPMLPYQHLLYKTLQEEKLIVIRKSRGLGVTEFLLRYLAYQCITDKWKPNSRICLVCGPRIDIAEDLIARFKGLFSKVALALFDKSKSTVAVLNCVKIEAFPSHHVDTMRGLDNVKFIMSDESDFYPPFQQQAVRSVTEGLLAKPNSSPTIIHVSTANAPNGLLQQLEQDKNNLYYSMLLDYRFGLEGPSPIYSQEQIDIAMKSPEWPREYLCQYLGQVGNVFSPLSIENAQKIPYNPDEFILSRYSIGVDPGFGTFGIVVTRFVNNRIEVVIEEDHKDPDFGFTEAINRIMEIRRQYGDDYFIHCDASNPIIWKELKRQCNEGPYDNDYVFGKIAEYEKNGWDIRSTMRIVPVPFSNNHAQMLQFTKSLLDEGLVLIDKRFDKLLISLRTAMAKEYSLSKKDTSYHDVLDGFRLSLQAYQRNR